VAAFTSQVLLKPHQSLLVKWFDKYKLKATANEVRTGKVEQLSRRETISFNDVKDMPNEAWDEQGNSDDEQEAEDLLERPKHVNLLDHSELDSIREFDPINDRIDKLIL